MVMIIQNQISHLNPHLDVHHQVPVFAHHLESLVQIMFTCLAIHSTLNTPSMILRLPTIMPIRLLVMVMLLLVNIASNYLMVACKLYATQPIGRRDIMQMSATKVNLNSLRDLVADQAISTKHSTTLLFPLKHVLTLSHFSIHHQIPPLTNSDANFLRAKSTLKFKKSTKKHYFEQKKSV